MMALAFVFPPYLHSTIPICSVPYLSRPVISREGQKNPSLDTRHSNTTYTRVNFSETVRPGGLNPDRAPCRETKVRRRPARRDCAGGADSSARQHLWRHWR
ncbi:hypothetical protein BDV59DRAFT_181354 [Aspergillus ambiguus]|uniref:uncharacterized protein n=1 Tax=Aspergillus ambiguus TaxID=176160 RepID=UPI003CCE32A9